MRIHILAALAFVMPACAGDITSPGGGGDDTGAVCGNGATEAGETCDDGNAVAGDGCSATCQTEQVATPHVSVSLDKTTITSDLNVANTIAVTATSEMGFAGAVTLSVSAKDPDNADITDWTSALDQSSLTLTAGGSATAMLTLSALGDAASLAGNLTITASGAATPGTATIPVTFNGVLDITFGDDNGTCSYPTTRTWRLKSGRQLAVYNGSTTSKLVVHTANRISGFNHQGDSGTAPGAAYVNTLVTGGVGNDDSFYCHNDGTANPASGYLAPGNTDQLGPLVQVVP
jgi:cysteine-rich repeat protein